MSAGEPGPQVGSVSTIYRPLDSETVRRSVELLLILSTLFLLDVVTTQIVLRMGGVELNPLMEGIVAHPALHLGIKILLLLVIFPVSLIAEQRLRGSAAFFYCVLILLYIVVDMNNLFVILPQVAM
jgi:Domain of unknown function (DUF5658)